MEDYQKSIEEVFAKLALISSKVTKSLRLKSRDKSKLPPLVVEMDSLSYQKQVLSVASCLSKFE
jgi:hypothetical protein